MIQIQAPFVASITIHPSFNRVNLYNDVALLHLITEFLKDVYPGAKEPPTKLVSLLTSDDPQLLVINANSDLVTTCLNISTQQTTVVCPSYAHRRNDVSLVFQSCLGSVPGEEKILSWDQKIGTPLIMVLSQGQKGVVVLYFMFL